MRFFSQLPSDLLSGRNTLILSDAYPPFVKGGAEISLYACVSAVSQAQREKMVVLVFSDDASEISYTETDGVLVLLAPSAASWPFESYASSELASLPLRRILGLRWDTRQRLARRILLSKNRRRSFRTYLEARAAPKGGILADPLLSPKDVRVQIATHLSGLMTSLTYLVADNTRSILIGAKVLEAVGRPINSAAVVRDNRFHCARPSQSRMVKNRFCSNCDFTCAAEDTPKHAELRKVTLRKTASSRSSALNTYKKVIVTSHELARHLSNVVCNGAELIRVPNTYGHKHSIDEASMAVAQLPQSELTIVGMLNENKGQLQFIKACADWLRAKDDIKIVLCGRGERIERAIKSFAKKENLENKIRLLGFRSQREVFQQIRKSKLVLAPTIWPEPFGRLPLEAGISGRAIVAFAVGGLVESIINGKTGYLVKAGDYKSFCDRVDELLSDSESRLSMETAARAHIAKTYGPDKTTQIFKKVVFDAET